MRVIIIQHVNEILVTLLQTHSMWFINIIVGAISIVIGESRFLK
jgi:hypothetical protein